MQHWQYLRISWIPNETDIRGLYEKKHWILTVFHFLLSQYADSLEVNVLIIKLSPIPFFVLDFNINYDVLTFDMHTIHKAMTS